MGSGLNRNSGGSFGWTHARDFSLSGTFSTAAPTNKCRIDENGSFICRFLQTESQDEAKMCAFMKVFYLLLDWIKINIFFLLLTFTRWWRRQRAKQLLCKNMSACLLFFLQPGFQKLRFIKEADSWLMHKNNRVFVISHVFSTPVLYFQPRLPSSFHQVSMRENFSTTSWLGVLASRFTFICSPSALKCVFASLPSVFVPTHQQMRGAVSQVDAGEISRRAADANRWFARLQAVNMNLKLKAMWRHVLVPVSLQILMVTT